MSSVLRLWSELHGQKLAWANRAYARFVENIDPELRRYISTGPGEVMVVLYGETQVGKTTLLLKLMGIRDDSSEEVSLVLRGGQSSGKSSTSMPMRYRVSDNDSWYLIVDGKKSTLSNQGVKDALAKIRNDVEQGHCGLEQSKPIELHIPAQYFDVEHKKRLRVNILDLPGINSRNANEETHVRQIAECYVPAADLILMVGLANGLGFLKPENMKLPQLADWRYAPQRFRIITTYSTSADTIVKWLKDLVNESKMLDKETIRNRLMEQVGTHFETGTSKLTMPKEVKKEYFYPLEFGKSWSDLETSKPGIFKMIRPVMEELFSDLYRDIAESATEHNRIMQAAQLHIVAAKHKEKKLSEYQERLNTLEVHLKKKIDDSEKFKSAADKSLRDIKESEAKHINMENAEVQLRGLANECIQAKGINERIDENTEYFRNYLTHRGEELKKGVVEFLECSNKEFDVAVGEDFSTTKVGKLIDEYLADFRDRLNRYSNSEYLPRVFDNYKKDKNTCESVVKNAMGKLRSEAIKAVCISLEKWNKVLENKIHDFESKQNGYRESAKRCNAKIKHLNEKIDAIKMERNEFEARIKSSLEQAKRFKFELNNEFNKEIRARQNRMKAQPPVKHFIELCAVLQMKNERDKLLA